MTNFTRELKFWLLACLPLPLLMTTLMATGVQAQTVVLSDTFVDTPGTTLQAHKPAGDPGNHAAGTWTEIGTQALVISPAGNQIVSTNPPAVGYYYETVQTSTGNQDVQVDVYNGGNSFLIAVHTDGTMNGGNIVNGYEFIVQGNQYAIYKGRAGAYAALQGFTPLTFTANAKSTFKISCRASGANEQITVFYGPQGGAQTQLVQVIDTGTATGAGAIFDASGYAILGSSGGNDTTYNPLSNFVLTDQSAAPALASGNPSVSALTPTTATFAGATASGGTAPLTYQLYRSAVSGFAVGAGNKVGAASSAAPAGDSGLVAGTPYYWRVATTDSSNPALVSISAQFAAVTPAKTYVIGLIADSIGAGFQASNPQTTSAAALLQSRLSKALGWAVKVNNQSVSSSTTSDWLATSTTQESSPALAGSLVSGTLMGTSGTGSTATNIWAKALAGFQSTGVNLFQLQLGVNNVKTGVMTPPATYLSDVSTIVSQCKAAFPAVPIVLIPPTYTVPGTSSGTWTEASAALLQSYGAGLATLSGPGVFVGQSPYTFSLNNAATELADGVHPNDAGYSDLASVWFASDYPVLVPASSTASSTGSTLTLTLSRNSNGQPVLAWTADPAATLYKIMRSMDGAIYTQIGSAPSGTTTYTDTTRPATGTAIYHVISTH